MGKNHHYHLTLEKELKLKIKEGAEKQRISMAEYIRRKIKEESQLDRIEKSIKNLDNWLKTLWD